MFYQKGENKFGGVLVMVRNFMQVKRVECSLPNVCVVDVKSEEEIRIVGVYASESRSWNWQQISPLLSENCVIYGDFNVDLEQDGSKAVGLLNWADSYFLAPFTPDNPTSLRSNRVIDYAFSNSAKIDIQTYKGNTTSDHYPILSVLSTKIKETVKGQTVHWKVFNLVTEYTFYFWEKYWSLNNLDMTYNDYVQFLRLLSARCTIFFPLSKYRVAIPAELRSFLSYVRALSFRQMRTKNIELKNHVRAFDMLWHEGCIGKLRQMGIPLAYTEWIKAWLENRRGYIEINGEKSRWFNIEKGGPQGGILTPTVFISYHADMPDFLSWCTSHFFADDLAAILAGQIGIKYSKQCLDLEKKLKLFVDQLEYYCLLT
ncbi:unnamed protein product, partial [Rotaria socialis]